MAPRASEAEKSPDNIKDNMEKAVGYRITDSVPWKLDYSDCHPLNTALVFGFLGDAQRFVELTENMPRTRQAFQPHGGSIHRGTSRTDESFHSVGH